MLTLCRGTHMMPALSSMPDVAYYAQNYADPIGAALMASIYSEAKTHSAGRVCANNDDLYPLYVQTR